MNYANSFEINIINDDVYEDIRVILNLRMQNNFSIFPSLENFFNIDKLNKLKENEIQNLLLVNEITPKWFLKGYSINDLILKQNKKRIEFKKGIIEDSIFKDQSYLVLDI